MSVIDRIAERMKELGVSQARVARELEITRASVSQWFSGRSKPSDKSISKLAVILDTSEQWLISGRGPKEVKRVKNYYDLLNQDINISELYSALKQKIQMMPEGYKAAMIELICRGLNNDDDGEQMSLIKLLQKDMAPKKETENE